jgi:hypothetical protein
MVLKAVKKVCHVQICTTIEDYVFKASELAECFKRVISGFVCYGRKSYFNFRIKTDLSPGVKLGEAEMKTN